MISIVDYGMGNLGSVKRKLDRIGAEAVITSEPDQIRQSDKLILPGVGHFSSGMENITGKTLKEKRLFKLLGIEDQTVRLACQCKISGDVTLIENYLE